MSQLWKIFGHQNEYILLTTTTSKFQFWTFHHCYIHSLDSKKARIQYVHTRSVNIPSDPKYSKIVKNRELCEYEGPSLRVALF